jgi:hypothetical protein
MHINRGVAQLASAPGLGPGGRRFKSSHPDHNRMLFLVSCICQDAQGYPQLNGQYYN